MLKFLEIKSMFLFKRLLLLTALLLDNGILMEQFLVMLTKLEGQLDNLGIMIFMGR